MLKIKDSREDLAFSVFSKVLDYDDIDLIKKISEWGLKEYDILNTNYPKYELRTIGDTDKGRFFVYMVTFAFIFGGFVNRAFGRHNFVEALDELEFDLDDFNLEYKDIKSFLEEDISNERKRWIKTHGAINSQDIWTSIVDYKQSIYECLVGLIKERGEKEPVLKLYNSLSELLETKDEETGETVSYVGSFGKQLSAYEYIENGFSS